MIAFVAVCIFGIAVAMCVAPDDSNLLVSELTDPSATMWTIISSALVLIMTPGLAFFYGGMVSKKNMIATMAAVLINMAVIPVMWSIIGFSLAFGESAGYPDMIGTPRTYGIFYNVDSTEFSDFGVPITAFWIFQGMFAILTPAILVGSIADRVNIASLFLFVPMWHMAVYCPVAFMVFNGGLISQYGVVDFAGGMVVHMSSGWSALAAAFFLGSRKAASDGPASVPYTILGAALLWFGWFGFNAGSALAGSPTAGLAFANTIIATSTGMLAWILMDQLYGRPFKVTGIAFGIVCGLVGITPACASVNYGAAAIIGIVAAMASSIVQWFMHWIGFLVVDDTLDVFAAHGVAGTAGMIMTSLFQYYGVPDGAFYGNPIELGSHPHPDVSHQLLHHNAC
eukprot:364933-Chlamydomonas_euryale.AAC.14